MDVQNNYQIMELLTLAVNQNASDLHIAAGSVPRMRIDGELQALNIPSLDQTTAQQLIFACMDSSQQQQFQQNLDIDFAFTIAGLARFRVNVFQQIHGIAAVFRVVPQHIQTLEALQLPDILTTIATLPQGLVLITGPTGSGKSTTLAAMLNYLNLYHARHIVTIEDPIEFIYRSQKSLINQREVLHHTQDFASALRAVLRQDPDVILLGEMRDPTTIRLALTAAETGHLVLATLHTATAARAMSRIIDVFPAEEKAIIRTLLANSLEAVFAQQLVRKIGGGRIAAHEILLCTQAIRNLIREDKIAQIYSLMQTGAGYGMKTLDQHLNELLQQGLIVPG